MCRIPVRFDDRANNKKKLASSMQKNSGDLVFELFLGTIRMLSAQARQLYSSSHPIKLIGKLQSLLSRHAFKNSQLFRARLFIRQYVKTMPYFEPWIHTLPRVPCGICQRRSETR